MSRNVAGISDRRLAESTMPGEQHRARRRGGEQAVEPALLDVAGEVDAGRGAGEARRPAAG